MINGPVFKNAGSKQYEHILIYASLGLLDWVNQNMLYLLSLRYMELVLLVSSDVFVNH